MIKELESTSLFTGLDSPVLNDISTFCTKLHLADGDILISENDTTAFDIFLICHGPIEIISNGTEITSKEVQLSKHDNDVFGEISWLTRGKRTATIRCTGNVEAICIDGVQLANYLSSHPDAGYPVIQKIAISLAVRLNQTDLLLKQLLWNSFC